MEAVNGVSEVDKAGPPAPSPLTGCYLLVVVGEPHSKEHKDIILRRIAKGLLSWDISDCHVDLERELAIINEQAPDGEDARYGERLIQFASENLVTEILIHPAISTLSQCMKNLLSSFTRHRHIIHAGYTFAANGSWILQDGTFSLTDFSEAFQEIEVQRVLRAYDNSISLDIHCSPEGDWTRLPKESFTKNCKVRVNPDDVLTSGSPPIVNFLNYISPFLVPTDIETLLESSDVVGNIRFSHPTLYVFPGGQGDAALFGINGFNMLVDGGFARKACFWDFVRHLDRLDAVLLTRVNNSNVSGISSVLRRKRFNTVYPQIGHFFCNIQERKAILSPDGDKDKDPLIVNLLEEGQDIVSNLRQLHLQPQACYREIEPINLYHKVGHGTLDMYVLSPAKESKEVREFIQKWNTNDQRLFTNQRNGRDFTFPTQNLVSICALLVWQPANANDSITRILFPGSTPQHKIFEGLDRLKQLECIKYPSCSAKTLTPSLMKSKQAKVEKLIQQDQKENKKERLVQQPDSKAKLENKVAEENIKNSHQTNGVSTHTQVITEKIIKKHDSTESDKSGPPSGDAKKPEDGKEPAGLTNGKHTEEKIEKAKPKAKPEQRPKVEPKVFKHTRSIERKPKAPIEKKASPTTPKKTLETKMNGDGPAKPKTLTKVSPSATPAKSAKEANNRKVVESKYKVAPKKEISKPDKKEPKPERKPISRRPKETSPSSKTLESPIKKPTELHKLEARKTKLEKEGTTDSSTVSTPSADAETALKKDISKLTPEELEQLKARELAELKEEQEVVKEIEAVFRKSEHKVTDDSDLRKVKNISVDDKTEGEEYLIIEKEEIEHDSLDEKETKESETQKHLRDSEESEKQRKLSGDVIPEDVKPTEIPIVTDEVLKVQESDVIPPHEIAKPQDEKEQPKEVSKEVSVTSPDDKVDLSSGKKMTDRDIDEENKDANILESQPDEKFSTPIESGATTAPTLPEDERIPLDEIKEDNVDQIIEEKYVKEDTKEKEIPVVQLPPKTTDNVAKLPTVVGIRLDKQTPIRDLVKTPDEVADLPVHEEVDIDHYEQYNVTTPKQEDLKQVAKLDKVEKESVAKPDEKVAAVTKEMEDAVAEEKHEVKETPIKAAEVEVLLAEKSDLKVEDKKIETVDLEKKPDEKMQEEEKTGDLADATVNKYDVVKGAEAVTIAQEKEDEKKEAEKVETRELTEHDAAKVEEETKDLKETKTEIVKEDLHKEDLHKEDIHKEDIQKRDIHTEDLHKEEKQEDLHKKEKHGDVHKEELHKEEKQEDVKADVKDAGTSEIKETTEIYVDKSEMVPKLIFSKASIEEKDDTESAESPHKIDKDKGEPGMAAEAEIEKADVEKTIRTHTTEEKEAEVQELLENIDAANVEVHKLIDEINFTKAAAQYAQDEAERDEMEKVDDGIEKSDVGKAEKPDQDLPTHVDVKQASVTKVEPAASRNEQNDDVEAKIVAIEKELVAVITEDAKEPEKMEEKTDKSEKDKKQELVEEHKIIPKQEDKDAKPTKEDKVTAEKDTKIIETSDDKSLIKPDQKVLDEEQSATDIKEPVGHFVESAQGTLEKQLKEASEEHIKSVDVKDLESAVEHKTGETVKDGKTIETELNLKEDTGIDGIVPHVDVHHAKQEQEKEEGDKLVEEKEQTKHATHEQKLEDKADKKKISEEEISLITTKKSELKESEKEEVVHKDAITELRKDAKSDDIKPQPALDKTAEIPGQVLDEKVEAKDEIPVEIKPTVKDHEDFMTEKSHVDDLKEPEVASSRILESKDLKETPEKKEVHVEEMEKQSETSVRVAEKDEQHDIKTETTEIKHEDEKSDKEKSVIEQKEEDTGKSDKVLETIESIIKATKPAEKAKEAGEIKIIDDGGDKTVADKTDEKKVNIEPATEEFKTQKPTEKKIENLLETSTVKDSKLEDEGKEEKEIKEELIQDVKPTTEKPLESGQATVEKVDIEIVKELTKLDTASQVKELLEDVEKIVEIEIQKAEAVAKTDFVAEETVLSSILNLEESLQKIESAVKEGEAEPNVKVSKSDVSKVPEDAVSMVVGEIKTQNEPTTEKPHHPPSLELSIAEEKTVQQGEQDFVGESGEKTVIQLFHDDSLEISKIDKKLQDLKDTVDEGDKLDLMYDELENTGKSPNQIKNEIDILDKIELGRKSPKEREQDVAIIVASVAEVLKSDAPLEEFEGKIPLEITTFGPYELRETHITTVESPIREDVIVDKMQMRPIEEEKSVPLDFISTFLHEERKVAPLHTDYDNFQKEESRLSSLLKDSNELIQATSKIISDIKQSSKVDDDLVSEATSSPLESCPKEVVQEQPLDTKSESLDIKECDIKMDSSLVTRKSIPDIKEKDVIDLADKLQTSSGKSSPELKEPPKDIVEIDKTLISSGKTSPDSQDKSSIILDKTIPDIKHVPDVQKPTNGIDAKTTPEVLESTTSLSGKASPDIKEKGDHIKSEETKVDLSKNIISPEHVSDQIQESTKGSLGATPVSSGKTTPDIKEALLDLSRSIIDCEKITVNGNLEAKPELLEKTEIKDSGKITSPSSRRSTPDIKEPTKDIREVKDTVKSSLSATPASSGKTTPEIKELPEKIISEVKDTEKCSLEDTAASSGKTSPDINDVPDKIISEAKDTVKSYLDATLASSDNKESAQDLPEKIIPDAKDNVKSSLDATPASSEKTTPDIKESAHDVPETISDVKETVKGSVGGTLTTSGKSTPDIKDSGKDLPEVKDVVKSSLDATPVSSGKATPDIKDLSEKLISDVKDTVKSVVDGTPASSGKSTPDIKDSGKDLPEVKDVVKSSLDATPASSGKATPDIKDVPEKLISDVKDTVKSVVDGTPASSGKSTPDIKDSGKDLPEVKDVVKSSLDATPASSGKATPDIKDLPAKLVSDVKDTVKSDIDGTPASSGKSTPDIKDLPEVKDIVKSSLGATSASSGKTTPDIKDSVKDLPDKIISDVKDAVKCSVGGPLTSSGKSTPDIKDSAKDLPEKIVPEDIVESGKATPDVKDLPGKISSDVKDTVNGTPVSSGKSTPDTKELAKDMPKVESDKVSDSVKSSLETILASSGKSTPDIKESAKDLHDKPILDVKDIAKSSAEATEKESAKDVPVQETVKSSLDTTPATSGKVTPEIKEPAADLSKSIIDTEIKETVKGFVESSEIKGEKFASDIKDSTKSSLDTSPAVSGKTTPEIKEPPASKDVITGKASPDIVVATAEKDALSTGSIPSGKSTPEILEPVKDTLDTHKSPILSGRTTPDIVIDEDNSSVDSGRSTPDVELAVDTNKTDSMKQSKIVDSEIKTEPVHSESKQSTAQSAAIADNSKSPITSGKSTPDLQHSTKNGLDEIKTPADSRKSSLMEAIDIDKTSSTSGKSTPEIKDPPSVISGKITPDTKLPEEKESTKSTSTTDTKSTSVISEVKEQEAISEHKSKIESIAGPSSSSKEIPLSPLKTPSEDLEYSRKSTPDIADITKSKDLEETSSGRTTPPTVPVSPIIKEKHAMVHEQDKKDIPEVCILKATDARSSTPASDDCDISSGQVSRVLTTEEDDYKQVYSDDDDLPGSPMSATSQVAHSTSSQYDFEDSVRGIGAIDPMSTSFYGALPDDPVDLSKSAKTSRFLDEADVDFDKALHEHRQTRGEDLASGSPSHVYEMTTAKYSSIKLQEEAQKISTAIPKESLMTSSFIGSELPTDPKDDPIASWGKPLGLPSPAPLNDNKGTPKKERRIPSNVMTKNKLNEDKKLSDSKYDRRGKKINPVYVDLTYVPHHGNSNYSYVDFFKRIRARYYVFSGIEPSKEVYNALLEAKQTWEDKELEVTIIPTYDTDVLGYWVAENEDLLAKYKIDLSPSASRCTINLQDHETSCSAYRLEFS